MEENFTYFSNEKGDYTIVYKEGSEHETCITFVKKEERAKITCEILNTIWNTRQPELNLQEACQIDFGVHVRCKMQVVNNKIEVISAVNGYGDPISKKDIIITDFEAKGGEG